jgi:DNA-binding winged helix-turn-helix (wHTH) protein/Tfp pilus assembly protein PilF
MGASPEVYELGDFVLDVGERRLVRSGVAVSLPPKAFDLLVALVRRAGTLVLKRDLLDLVWPDASVEEGILAVHVSALRRVLDTSERNGCIETVPRAGYRFIGAVRRREVAPALSLRWPVGVLPAQPAVSELIGRGRSYLLAASRSDVAKAVEAFHAALELDSQYAPAHAGMALACCARAELRLASPAMAYRDARDAALRALAMDPANADAQVALATVLLLSDWNWSGARRSVERALEIDPDHAEGWLLYGRLLEALGRLDEGLQAKQKALERNPASAVVHLQIAVPFWNQRGYDEMIEWARRSLALDPDHVLAREFIASAYLKKGDIDLHMRESLAHATAAGAPPELIEELQAVYASDGRPGIVRYVLRTSANAPAVQLALFHGEAGDLDAAFFHLDAAIARRDPALVHLAVAPQWDWLRGDARFDERLLLMGLGVTEVSRSS